MENPLHPRKVKIIKAEQMSPTVRLLRVKGVGEKLPLNKSGLVFTPGQFVLAGVWGGGEAPFGLASSPFEEMYYFFSERPYPAFQRRAITNREGGKGEA